MSTDCKLLPLPFASPATALLSPQAALKNSLALYASLSWKVRAFVQLRALLAPLAKILEQVPETGRILDVGCGHGLFTNAVALGSAGRSVLGVDPSALKIQVARTVAPRVKNVAYLKGLLSELRERDFDAITILDVLYLLPLEQKKSLLAECRRRLRSDGRLILKASDTRPGWKLHVAQLQERLMTGSGLTLGGNGLHFLSREQNAALLHEAGFQTHITVLPTLTPYPHTLFVCEIRD